MTTVGASRIFQRAARLDFLDGFGIAIGRQHVAMAHLVKRLASVSLQGYRLLPLPPPEQADARKAAIAAAVSDFVTEFSVDTDRTYVSLPRAHALMSRLSLPAAAKADLRQVVEFEIDRLIPLSRDEIYYDFFVREVGGASGKLEVTVVSVPRRIVAEHLAALDLAGVRARSVVISSIALLDFLRFSANGELDGVVLLVDEGGTIEFDYVGKSLLGASHLVRAEEVSTPAAISRLVGRETASLGAPNGSITVYAWHDGAGAADSAGQSVLPADLLQSGADLVRRAAGSLIAPEGFFTAPPAPLAPAIGAALAAVREGSAGLNLLPPEERRAVEEGAPVVPFLLAAVLLLVTLVWVASAMVKDHRVDSALHAEIAALDPQIRTVRHDEDEARALRDKLRVLMGEEQHRVSVYLKELTDVIPADAYLTTYRVRNGKLELDGFARAASDLVPLLEKSPYFKNVQFNSPVTKVQNNQERFSLTADLEQ
ncbi:MAG TPA: PilN domain-containing protein [Candidatus Bathyarchaeia archaeon]|nr:PilN domain-containing protein [Candidatus Bathyarchaeia archaeon]